MKAISLYPDWAMMVALGVKTVECRSWSTGHRGELLICSSSRKVRGCVFGHALCVVSLDSVAPFLPSDVHGAFMDGLDVPDGSYAWHLSNPRLVEPFRVKGRQRLFDVPDADIRVIGSPSRSTVSVFEPLIYKPDSDDSYDFWDLMASELSWPVRP